jgi:hypothetical protein
MNKLNATIKPKEDEQGEDREECEQRALLKAFAGTVGHYFGKWQTIFGGVRDPRNPEMIIYPLAGLMCTGVLMFLFRLGARREINYKLRGNDRSRVKFAAWFGVEEIPHGDTLHYAFKGLDVEEVQGVVCWLMKQLIRKKVLDSFRLLGVYFLVAIDGTGRLTFRERHCEHCLTQKLSNGEVLYYHPVLEAKLVTPNGFAFSLMTEFIENMDPQADKQDCELKAFYRLAARLKKRFPRLLICLLLDGLYACGPVFQLCEDNNWKYLIVLKDDDLPHVHRSFAAVLPHLPESHKEVPLEEEGGKQVYRWANDITYKDSQQRVHQLAVLQCHETKTDPSGQSKTNKHLWLTNFTLTTYNVDRLANQGGRLRWKVENEGFNVQKNGGFNLEHPYSQDETAGKVFYFLLQIAYLIFQLIEKGSLFRNAFPNGVGSLKNIADRLLEAWRNLRISAFDFALLSQGRFQIRFDTS